MSHEEHLVRITVNSEPVEVEVDIAPHLPELPTTTLQRELYRRRELGDHSEWKPDGDELGAPEQRLMQTVAYRVRVLGVPLEQVVDELMREHDVDWFVNFSEVG